MEWIKEWDYVYSGINSTLIKIYTSTFSRKNPTFPPGTPYQHPQDPAISFNPL